jgi:hypothetical protein
MPINSLGFTICQVPIIYKLSNVNNIKIFLNNTESTLLDGDSLSLELSKSIFKRENMINRIEVQVKSTLE